MSGLKIADEKRRASFEHIFLADLSLNNSPVLV